jgi:hypothetical protein
VGEVEDRPGDGVEDEGEDHRPDVGRDLSEGTDNPAATAGTGGT